MKDLTGEKFGRLTVVERTDKRNKERYVYYKVKCDCGNEELRTSKALSRAKQLNNQSCCAECVKVFRTEKFREKMKKKNDISNNS